MKVWVIAEISITWGWGGGGMCMRVYRGGWNESVGDS